MNSKIIDGICYFKVGELNPERELNDVLAGANRVCNTSQIRGHKTSLDREDKTPESCRTLA